MLKRVQEIWISGDFKPTQELKIEEARKNILPFLEQELKVEITDDAFQKYFDLIDANKNERFSVEELFNFLKSHKPKEGQESKESEDGDAYTEFEDEEHEQQAQSDDHHNSAKTGSHAGIHELQSVPQTPEGTNEGLTDS